MTIVPSLTLKNLPEALLEALRQRAAAHRRSLNSEILVLLEEATLPRPLDAEGLLEQLDVLHRGVDEAPLRDDDISRTKRAGRA